MSGIARDLTKLPKLDKSRGDANGGVLQRWRRELFSEAALTLKKGRLAPTIGRSRGMRADRE